jgi:hypothetical protein
MRSRPVASVLTSLLFTAIAVLPGGVASNTPAATAAPACHPIQTTPSFRGEVPTAEQVLGFSLGSREVTSAESNAYVDAVAEASPRVVSGTLVRPGRGESSGSRSWEDPETSPPRVWPGSGKRPAGSWIPPPPPP